MECGWIVLQILVHNVLSMTGTQSLCAVIATVGYAHRIDTLGEDGVGKYSPF